MKCSIMQPTFLPWLGFFDLIRKSDYFVFYDDVQFAKQTWQSRNKIKAGSQEQILSIPIKKTTPFNELLIKDVQIDNGKPWAVKHLKSIQQNYSKTEFFEDIFSKIEPIFSEDNEFLADFNINLIKRFCGIMGIESEFIKSSEMDVSKGTKEDGIISICDFLKVENYLSPMGAYSYLNNKIAQEKFLKSNITVHFQNFSISPYPQKGKSFVPYLSALDALFNIGGEAARELILESSGIYKSFSDLKSVI